MTVSAAMRSLTGRALRLSPSTGRTARTRFESPRRWSEVREAPGQGRAAGAPEDVNPDIALHGGQFKPDR
jgi:hypothetical protein